MGLTTSNRNERKPRDADPCDIAELGGDEGRNANFSASRSKEPSLLGFDYNRVCIVDLLGRKFSSKQS